MPRLCLDVKEINILLYSEEVILRIAVNVEKEDKHFDVEDGCVKLYLRGLGGRRQHVQRKMRCMMTV